mgnify:CR=1 FL=1|jgi:RNA polymerase sigma-32 factor
MSFHQIASHTPLSREAEYKLAIRWVEHGDKAAADQLVMANMRFVIKVARRYTHYGFPLVDLVQEGTIGLLESVHRLKPVKGTRVITYAAIRIRASIQEYIQRNWSVVHLNKRNLFNMLHSPGSKLRQALDTGTDVDEEITLSARVNPDDLTSMVKHLTRRDASLDALILDQGDVFEDGDIDPSEWTELRDRQERFATWLSKVKGVLDEREMFILEHRLLSESPLVLSEIGDHFGFSKERARQLDAALRKRLRFLGRSLAA